MSTLIHKMFKLSMKEEIWKVLMRKSPRVCRKVPVPIIRNFVAQAPFIQSIYLLFLIMCNGGAIFTTDLKLASRATFFALNV